MIDNTTRQLILCKVNYKRVHQGYQNPSLPACPFLHPANSQCILLRIIWAGDRLLLRNPFSWAKTLLMRRQLTVSVWLITWHRNFIRILSLSHFANLWRRAGVGRGVVLPLLENVRRRSPWGVWGIARQFYKCLLRISENFHHLFDSDLIFDNGTIFNPGIRFNTKKETRYSKLLKYESKLLSEVPA